MRSECPRRSLAISAFPGRSLGTIGGAARIGVLAGRAAGLYDNAVRPESLEGFMLTDNRAGQTRLTLLYVLVIAVLAALLRLAPRWFDLGPGVWNLMPVGALALFAGSRLRTRSAWLVPLAV